MSFTLKLILIGLLSITISGCGGSTDSTEAEGRIDDPVDPDPVDPDPVDPDPVDPDPVDPDPVDPDPVDPTVLIFGEGRLNSTVLG